MCRSEVVKDYQQSAVFKVTKAMRHFQNRSQCCGNLCGKEYEMSLEFKQSLSSTNKEVIKFKTLL